MIEITLTRIEYLKSSAVVVESDEPKVICLLSLESMMAFMPERCRAAGMW